VLFLGISQSTEGENALITEYVGRGSLKKLIKSEPDYLNSSPSRRFAIAAGVADGMVYLHHCTPPIMHRDLTTANILVHYDGTPKICDFGMSRLFVGGDALSQAVGCMTSMAPEVYRGEPYTPSIDVFSFGVVIFELFVGRAPNGNTDPRKYAHRVAMEGFRAEVPATVPPFWRNLLTVCWRQEPIERPTFDSIQKQLKSASPGDTRLPPGPSSDGAGPSTAAWPAPPPPPPPPPAGSPPVARDGGRPPSPRPGDSHREDDPFLQEYVTGAPGIYVTGSGGLDFSTGTNDSASGSSVDVLGSLQETSSDNSAGLT
jgi:serine/threonine protein kinase